MHNKKPNVLSLCDGMSCGQIVLKELGIDVENYFASEIDKIAIKVTQDNFPQTIQLGDIRGIDNNVLKSLPQIDLVLCGFPCKDLSICTRNGGSRNWEKMHQNGVGLNGKHSGLYHNFLEIYRWILQYNNADVKFLVENVSSMKSSEKQVIDEDLQIVGIEIDSAEFSAQERKRLYWTNIPVDVMYGVPCGDVLKDILDSNVPEKFYDNRPIEFAEPNGRMVGKLVFDFKAHDIAKRVYNVNYKSPTLTACRGGNLQKKIFTDGRVRKLTPHEYRKLQTIPEWYKTDVADSHIYNLCGDGWTVEVIKFILKNFWRNVCLFTHCF